MSVDPKYLPPPAEQQAIAQQQVEAFKRELYAHVLNLQRLEALPADTSDQEEATHEAIETITAAIDVTQAAADEAIPASTNGAGT